MSSPSVSLSEPKTPAVAPRRWSWARVARWVVALGLLGWLGTTVDLGAVWAVMRAASPWLLLAALGAAAADRALMIGKWIPLLRVQAPGVPLGRAAQVYLASGFANLFMPVTVGGDALRAVILGRPVGRTSQIGASIVAERMLGLIGLAFFVVVALALAAESSARERTLVWWGIGIGVVSVGAAATPFVLRRSASLSRLVTRWLGSGKLAGHVRAFAKAYVAYADHPGVLLGVGALSVVEQGFPVLVLWVVARALGTAITLKMLVVAVPVTLLLSRLPIAVGGLGVGEVSLVFFLGLAGAAAPEALAVALAARVVELTALLPGALMLHSLTSWSPSPSAAPSTGG